MQLSAIAIAFFIPQPPLLAHDVDHIFAVFDAIVLAEINIRCAAQLDLALCDRKNAVVPREQTLEMAGCIAADGAVGGQIVVVMIRIVFRRDPVQP